MDYSILNIFELKKIAKKIGITIGKKSRQELIFAIKHKLSNRYRYIKNKVYLISNNINNNCKEIYKVIITKKYIKIYKSNDPFKQINNCSYKIDELDELILNIKKYTKIYIGQISDSNKMKRNSILIKINENNYIYIGELIYQFSLDNDEIINYNSNFVNNNVEYSYAIGKHNTYLMIDKVYISNTDRNNKNPYEQFYNENESVSFVKKLFNRSKKMYNSIDVNIID